MTGPSWKEQFENEENRKKEDFANVVRCENKKQIAMGESIKKTILKQKVNGCLTIEYTDDNFISITDCDSNKSIEFHKSVIDIIRKALKILNAQDQ